MFAFSLQTWKSRFVFFVLSFFLIGLLGPSLQARTLEGTAKLTSLTENLFDDFEPAFDPSQGDYTIWAAPDESSVHLSMEAQDGSYIHSIKFNGENVGGAPLGNVTSGDDFALEYIDGYLKLKGPEADHYEIAFGTEQASPDLGWLENISSRIIKVNLFPVEKDFFIRIFAYLVGGDKLVEDFTVFIDRECTLRTEQLQSSDLNVSVEQDSDSTLALTFSGVDAESYDIAVGPEQASPAFGWYSGVTEDSTLVDWPAGEDSFYVRVFAHKADDSTVVRDLIVYVNCFYTPVIGDLGVQKSGEDLGIEVSWTPFGKSVDWTFDLLEGEQITENTIDITVKGNDGSTNTYSILVKNEPPADEETIVNLKSPKDFIGQFVDANLKLGAIVPRYYEIAFGPEQASPKWAWARATTDRDIELNNIPVGEEVYVRIFAYLEDKLLVEDFILLVEGDDFEIVAEQLNESQLDVDVQKGSLVLNFSGVEAETYDVAIGTEQASPNLAWFQDIEEDTLTTDIPEGEQDFYIRVFAHTADGRTIVRDVKVHLNYTSFTVSITDFGIQEGLGEDDLDFELLFPQLENDEEEEEAQALNVVVVETQSEDEDSANDGGSNNDSDSDSSNTDNSSNSSDEGSTVSNNSSTVEGGGGGNVDDGGSSSGGLGADEDLVFEIASFDSSQPTTRANVLKYLMDFYGISPYESVKFDPFLDVDDDDLYAPYIAKAKALGYVSGYSDGTFRPNDLIIRAEFFKLLAAVNGYKVRTVLVAVPFFDVSPANWYAPYATYALDRGLLFVYPGGVFDPGASVSWGELEDWTEAA